MRCGHCNDKRNLYLLKKSAAFILINIIFNEHRVFDKEQAGPEYSLKKKMVPRGFFILDFAFHCEQEGHLPLFFTVGPSPTALHVF